MIAVSAIAPSVATARTTHAGGKPNAGLTGSAGPRVSTPAPGATTACPASAVTGIGTPTSATGTPTTATTTGTPGTGTTGTGAGTTGTGSAGAPPATGGTGLGPPTGPTDPATPADPATGDDCPTVPGDAAEIVDGVAYAPAGAPLAVQEAIWAGNEIRTKPYVYGGGHGSFAARGYDCSGSVSYVLHAAGLLAKPMDSSDLASWGLQGAGYWITVYTNPGHAFVQIAGIRFDTSSEQDPDPPAGTGPRWRPLVRATTGFQARHPDGY